MQTFDALLPASHTSSTRNSEAPFTSEKPRSTGEKFGDVMDRALTGKSRESTSDDNETQATEKSGESNTQIPVDASHAKHAAKSKKTLREELARDDDTATAQPIVVTISAPHISQLAQAQMVSADEGTSENAPEADAGADKGKQTTATGNSDDASKSITAQLLALANPSLGMPLPSSPPQSPAGARTSTEAKGTSSSVLNTDTKAGTASDIPVNSEASGKRGELPPAKPDLKSVEAKDSANASKDTSAASDATAQAQALQPTEPDSGKVDLAPALPVPISDSQNPQTSKAKASVENVSASAVDPSGTSAAKQYTTMKKAEKTPKVAGPTEQDLPGTAASGTDDLLTGQKLAVHALTHGTEKLDATVPVEPPAASRISTSPESAAPAITSAAVSPSNSVDSRLRVLERTHDIVALHAMRLSQSGSDSLHVVVKPGNGIQLSLELRQNAGSIEVRASLHKGDFEHLSQYWPELQQRMEARGVRVGTLTTSDNFSDTSHQQFQQSKQQQSSNQDPLYAGAFAEFALAGSLSEAPAVRAARATAYRGWETWA